MRMSVAMRALGAVLLLGAAVLARNEAGRARSEAVAWQQLVTLRLDQASTAAPAANWLASLVGEAANDRRRQATVDYWQGRYDALTQRDSAAADPDVLFVAANAAYRVARHDHPVGPDAARRLDSVVQAYSSVLKAAPRHADAAYNLEYVARVRDQIRVMKTTPGENIPAGAFVAAGEFPIGPTVHGFPGGPPRDQKPDDIQILKPREQGEREASEPGQARGSTVKRKG
jgi:hypothetical protein